MKKKRLYRENDFYDINFPKNIIASHLQFKQYIEYGKPTFIQLIL